MFFLIRHGLPPLLLTFFCLALSCCASKTSQELQSDSFNNHNRQVIQKHYIAKGPCSGCENPPPVPKNYFKPGEVVCAYNYITGMESGDISHMIWRSPSGKTHHIQNRRTNRSGKICFWTYITPEKTRQRGNWSVDFIYNGEIMYTDQFFVGKDRHLKIEMHYTADPSNFACGTNYPKPKSAFFLGDSVLLYNYISSVISPESIFAVWNSPDKSSVRIDVPINANFGCFETTADSSIINTSGKWSVDFYYNDLKVYSDSFFVFDPPHEIKDAASRMHDNLPTQSFFSGNEFENIEIMPEQRMSVGILEIQSLNQQARSDEYGKVFTEILTTSFASSNAFKIIEREQLNKVLGEIKLTQSGIVDTSNVKILGNMVGADAIVLGSITKLGDDLRLDIRIIDVESGLVLTAEKIEGKADIKVIGRMADMIVSSMIIKLYN
jgi:TolB-like protein